jgi:hypothetical protein
MQTLVKNSETYRFYGSAILNSCSKQPADIIIIDYDCVPTIVNWVKSFDICNGQTINEQSGIIQSSNYPLLQSKINCTININSNSDKQKILNVYSITTELAVKLAGQQ